MIFFTVSFILLPSFYIKLMPIHSELKIKQIFFPYYGLFDNKILKSDEHLKNQCFCFLFISKTPDF